MTRRRDLRELVAELLGQRHLERDSLEREQAPLVVDTELTVGADPVRADDAVRGDERRQRAAPAERAGRARGAGVTGEQRELAVADDLPRRTFRSARAQPP